jgi:hypothetical protein
VTLAEHAVELTRIGARLGWWGVFPCKPRSKEPATPRGFHDATTDPDDVAYYWEANPDANIGIHPHHPLIIIDVDPRNNGNTSLAQLIDTLGNPGDTYTVVTGTSNAGTGYHLYYFAPNVTTHNPALAEGVDVKGPRGYILGPGSIHPNGHPYEIALPNPIATLPPNWQRALERTIPTRPAPRSRPVTTPSEAPYATASWTDLLTRDGWTIERERGEIQYWSRPGKDGGVSATIGYQGNDALHVFTSSVPQLEADRSISKWKYIADMHHAGDMRAAAQAWETQKAQAT